MCCPGTGSQGPVHRGGLMQPTSPSRFSFRSWTPHPIRGILMCKGTLSLTSITQAVATATQEGLPGAHSITPPGGNNVQLIDRVWQLGLDTAWWSTPDLQRRGESVQVGSLSCLSLGFLSGAGSLQGVLARLFVCPLRVIQETVTLRGTQLSRV